MKHWNYNNNVNFTSPSKFRGFSPIWNFRFIVWASCYCPVLGLLDLRAGVEQPFDCLIVQNCQVVQSMGISFQRIGDWKTTWSTIWSSAPHSQAAKEAIPHLHKQERKRSTPVRRRLSRTHTVLRRLRSPDLWTGWNLCRASRIGQRSLQWLFRHWGCHSSTFLLLPRDSVISPLLYATAAM